MRLAACHPDRAYVAKGLCRTCYQRIYRSGDTPPRHYSMKQRTEWTGSDIAKLKRLFHIAPRADLERELAPRSWAAIQDMAAKLGLVRPLALGGKRRWKKLAALHTPVFDLPRDVEIQSKRPWS